jgi:hypothetical protein
MQTKEEDFPIYLGNFPFMEIENGIRSKNDTYGVCTPPYLASSANNLTA